MVHPFSFVFFSHGVAMVRPWCVMVCHGAYLYFLFCAEKRHGVARVRPWCVMVCHGVSLFSCFFAEKDMVRPWCILVCHGVYLFSVFLQKKTWCGHGAAMVCHGVPWCVCFSCFFGRKTHGVAMVCHGVSFFGGFCSHGVAMVRPWCVMVCHGVYLFSVFLHKKTWCGHGLATVCRRCVKGSGSSRRMQDKAAAAAERSWGAAQKAPKLSMPPATPSPASLRHPFGCCLRIHVQRALAAAMMVMRPRVMAAHHVTTTAYTAAVAALFRSARRLRQWIDLDRLLRRLLLRQGRHATSALTGRFAARASLPGDRHRSGSRESRASLPGPCYQLDAKQGKS